MMEEEGNVLKITLGITAIIVGIPILASTIEDVLNYKLNSQKYKNRNERIKALQKDGANVNVNLNGEI